MNQPGAIAQSPCNFPASALPEIFSARPATAPSPFVHTQKFPRPATNNRHTIACDSPLLHHQIATRSAADRARQTAIHQKKSPAKSASLFLFQASDVNLK